MSVAPSHLPSPTNRFGRIDLERHADRQRPALAATLGVTQSALSQAIRGLEERLRIRLLTRTTRSVAPTVAGERLALAIGTRFDEIEAELDALTELLDKPAVTVRIMRR